MIFLRYFKINCIESNCAVNIPQTFYTQDLEDKKMGAWYKEQGEYVVGGLFALVALDIYMFLSHCITEQTAEGYGLMSLTISIPIFLVAYIDYSYTHPKTY